MCSKVYWVATQFRAVVNSGALLFRMKTKAAHDELVPVLAAEDPGLEQLAWRAPYKCQELRIQGRSVPFRLEGVGSRGNFSCLKAAVHCGGLLSRTCLFHWGCSAAAWQWSWPILGWFDFSHSQDDFQYLQRVEASKV